MASGKTILIGSLIALPIVGVAYYNYIVSNYDYSVGTVSLGSISGTNATMNIVVNVSSKIGIAFTITDIYFDIYLQGVKVGNVYQATTLVIPNYGQGQVVLTANVDLSQIENNIADILITGLSSGTYNVSLVGYSHVRVGILPFTTNVAIQQGNTLSI
jgi:LEA14-like dessication related protein